MTPTAKIFDALACALQRDPSIVKLETSGKLDTLLSGQYGQIVLFGAGGLGRRVAEVLRLVGVQPIAFSDNNPQLWGTSILGLPVYSPNDAIKKFAYNAVFIITIWRWPASESSGQRRSDLLALGCQRVCSVLPLFWKYPEFFLPYFCLDEPYKVVAAHAEVESALTLFDDDQSRTEFIRQALWRIDPDNYDIDSFSTETQYFPEDLFALTDHEVFVDVGGYDGDTARLFIEKSNNSFNALHVIEADPSTFARLESWRSTLPGNMKNRVTLYNVAASKEQRTMSFMAKASVDSRISESGSTLVQCDRLDNLLSGVKPSIIKMDIEGAEYDALQGASNLIHRYSPILAICLYHHQSDLWTIPAFIASRFTGYRLFLKAHTLDGADLVLYAIPADRKLR